jgi:pimeloyl-ACP methyl ester carboxylesterase
MANQLGVDIAGGGIKASGCCTPKEDKVPQKMRVPPKRVIPIIFLPGIMGSNLRNTAVRQRELENSNNIAWRPDNKSATIPLVNASPARRQSQLDPTATEVDIYDPQKNPTGDARETAAQRHKLPFFYMNLDTEEGTPLLVDDQYGAPNYKSKEVKALERGWGEVLFSSYGLILQQCEAMLNCGRPWLLGEVLNTNPIKWGASSRTPMPAITDDEFKRATAKCFFPVHAMGYNWLMSNGDSARLVSERITALMAKYKEKYQCEKVILVTHSMGGLLARALIHPEMGNLESVVLGVVHGVMPATGAAAAYKRMRAGTDEGSLGLSITSRVLGNYGAEVTAVLANSQGGLELLPSREYGNGWLNIYQDDKLLQSLPAENDPYTEIYSLRNGWYRLIREEWINPARRTGANLDRTCELIRRAGSFHDAISETYHPVSYAHYGVELGRRSWEKVSWILDKKYHGAKWRELSILADKEQGEFELFEPGTNSVAVNGSTPRKPLTEHVSFTVSIGENSGAGDQTVPMRSSEHQLLSGKFSGIFRQVGYEHQDSYKSWPAIYSTIYSLLRIASTMKWSS